MFAGKLQSGSLVDREAGDFFPRLGIFSSVSFTLLSGIVGSVDSEKYIFQFVY
jgi:hypothetical protein